MGLAIDTVASSAVNPGGTVTATAAATGDSLTLRASAPGAKIYLDMIVRGGAATGRARIRSPRMHDNVSGFDFNTGQVISVYPIPLEAWNPLYPLDALIVEVTGGAAETDAVAFQVYYQDLPGVSARLHSLGDVQGVINNLKGQRVAVAATGAAGTWTDTVITTTENVLKASTDYAVLGVITDLATTLVGIKGPDTGNLRVCVPGVTDSSDTSNYFAAMANWTGRPWIPVINSDNRFATFVSTFHHGATQAPNITLVLAELTSRLTP